MPKKTLSRPREERASSRRSEASRASGSGREAGVTVERHRPHYIPRRMKRENSAKRNLAVEGDVEKEHVHARLAEYAKVAVLGVLPD